MQLLASNRARLLVAHSADVERVTAEAVTFLQQQELGTHKRLAGDLGGTSQHVIPVAGEQEFVLADDLDAQVRRVV